MESHTRKCTTSSTLCNSILTEYHQEELKKARFRIF